MFIPNAKDILNQLNSDKTFRKSRKKNFITPSNEVQRKVKSFLHEAISNPSIINSLNQDEQQEMVIKHFKSENKKKRINE